MINVRKTLKSTVAAVASKCTLIFHHNLLGLALQGHILQSICERIRGFCSISVETELQPAHTIKQNVPLATEPIDHDQEDQEYQNT